MPNALPTNASIQPIAIGWKSGTLFSTLITGMAYPLLVDADSGRLLCDIGSNIQVTAQFPTVQTVQGTVSLAAGTSVGVTGEVEVKNDSGNPIPVMDHNSAKNGATYINTTGAKTGNWYAIQVVADAAFTLLTGTWTGDAVAAADIFPAGTVIYGNFTAITLASGKVIAYAI
jgi:hypothetical protein